MYVYMCMRMARQLLVMNTYMELQLIKQHYAHKHWCIYIIYKGDYLHEASCPGLPMFFNISREKSGRLALSCTQAFPCFTTFHDFCMKCKTWEGLGMRLIYMLQGERVREKNYESMSPSYSHHHHNL